MSTKQVLLIAVLLFLTFLALYTWNERTNTLDEASAHTGLEVSGGILEAIDSLFENAQALWYNYIDLTMVREDNAMLIQRVAELERELDSHNEALAELERLRAMYAVDVPEDWGRVITRVIAGKLGAFAALETIVLDKGYIAGAAVGRPLMTDRYLVGRIYTSAPSTSVALLIEDFGSKVAVVSSETRLHGILNGAGASNPLEIHFINQDTSLQPGEILYTSGLDNAFPKGIPVAQVTGSSPLVLNAYKIFYAEPLANFATLEELAVLIPPVGWQVGDQSPVLFTNVLENLAPSELLP